MTQISDGYDDLKIQVSHKVGRVYELIIDIESCYKDEETFTCFVKASSESEAERKALAIGRDFHDRDMTADEYREYFSSDAEAAIMRDAGGEL